MAPAIRADGRHTLAAAAAVLALAAAAPVAGGAHGQRDQAALGADLPIGLGIARVSPVPGETLYFYRHAGTGESPGDYPPEGAVRFGPGRPSVDIAEAPPWLVPERLKMDYELFHLRVVTLTSAWAEVIGSSRTGQTWWVDRTHVEFVAWPELLLASHSVEALDAEATPVRVRPLDDAPVLSTVRAPLPALAVQGDWLMVATGHLADRIRPEGWIRWRRGERLLVAYNPLS